MTFPRNTGLVITLSLWPSWLQTFRQP